MIRPYREDDLAELIEVWYRASLIAHSFFDDEFLAKEREAVAEQWLPVAETMVYESAGRVVGFISLIDTEVGGLFVHPDKQGRGIGRALMDWARASRPFLELSVFVANAIGRRFYAAYGFELMEHRIDAHTGQPELRLRLGDLHAR